MLVETRIQVKTGAHVARAAPLLFTRPAALDTIQRAFTEGVVVVYVDGCQQ